MFQPEMLRLYLVVSLYKYKRHKTLLIMETFEKFSSHIVRKNGKTQQTAMLKKELLAVVISIPAGKKNTRC